MSGQGESSIELSAATQASRYLRFIQVDRFTADWKWLGMEDEDLRMVEMEIIRDPMAFPVIAGTGGLRKLRHARQGKGKSHGIRVCYAVIERQGWVFLFRAYTHQEQDNISPSEKKEIRATLQWLNNLQGA